MKESADGLERPALGEGYMDDEMRDMVFDVYHDMRGLAVSLDAAAHGDTTAPELIVGYASEQIARLSDALAAAIRD